MNGEQAMDEEQTTACGKKMAPLERAAGERWLSLSLLIIAAVALGAAVNVREGLYDRIAVRFLSVGVLACVAAVVFARAPTWRWGRRLPVILLTGGIALQLVQLYSANPGTIVNARWVDGQPEVAPLSMPGRLFQWELGRSMHDELYNLRRDLPAVADARERRVMERRIREIGAILLATRFQIYLLIAAGLAAAVAIGSRAAGGVGRMAMPALLVTHLALGISFVRKTPDPYIDVYVFQQEACAALVRGENPYAVEMPNIYGLGSYVYAPGLEKDGRLTFGYPYMPLSLLMALPGYALGGDHRYAQAVAVTLAGALIAYANGGVAGGVGRLAAMLLLFTPRLFMVIELGWTDSFVVLLLAATIFSACRFPRAMPYVLGLLLASKQYTVLIVPLALLLVGRSAQAHAHAQVRREYMLLMAKALLVAAVVSLPLMLWDVRAFVRSAVMVQIWQPFREDALSYLAWLRREHGMEAAGRMAWTAFPAAVAAIGLALWRLPRCAGGFAAGIAVVYLAFLVVNKQAFCNYYFFVIGALACAVAAMAGDCTRWKRRLSAFMSPGAARGPGEEEGVGR